MPDQQQHTPGPWTCEPDIYALSMRQVSGAHRQPYHPFVVCARRGKRALTVAKVDDVPESELVARTNGYEYHNPPAGFGSEAFGCGGSSEANARLISAAPELLDAAVLAADLMEGHDSPAVQQVREVLLAAITKAKCGAK